MLPFFSFFFSPLFVFVTPFVSVVAGACSRRYTARSLARSEDATRGPKPNTHPFAAAASQPASKAGKQRSCVVLGHLGSICHMCAQIKHLCILQMH